MLREKELQEFNARIEGVKVAFPYLKPVQLIEDKEVIQSLHVRDKDYKEANMIHYDRVLCIGNEVINVNATSVSSIIEIVCKHEMGLGYCGRIGYLI